MDNSKNIIDNSFEEGYNILLSIDEHLDYANPKIAYTEVYLCPKGTGSYFKKKVAVIDYLNNRIVFLSEVPIDSLPKIYSYFMDYLEQLK